MSHKYFYGIPPLYASYQLILFSSSQWLKKDEESKHKREWERRKRQLDIE